MSGPESGRRAGDAKAEGSPLGIGPVPATATSMAATFKHNN